MQKKLQNLEKEKFEKRKIANNEKIKKLKTLPKYPMKKIIILIFFSFYALIRYNSRTHGN